MLIIFSLYIAVMIVTGGALLLLWRKDRAQTFTAILGASHWVWALNPFAYMAYQNPNPWLSALGMAGLIVVPSAYLTILVAGIGHLADRIVPRNKLWLIALGMALALSIPTWIERSYGQVMFACLSTVVGVLATASLWRLGVGARVSGLLLVLCGLNQFVYVLFGTDGVLWQTASATLLRTLLALSLIFAAWSRSMSAVHRLRDRFLKLTEGSPQGVVVVRDEQALYINPAFRRIFGMDSVPTHPPVFSQEWMRATVPHGMRGDVAGVLRQLAEKQISQTEWEGARVSLDGRQLYVRYKAWSMEWDGAPAWQIVASDETAQNEAAQALMWHATHDELTGLYNRSALLQRLRELFDDPLQHEFALILLDVDRFKLFNDAHGPAVGDEVLKSLAKKLSDNLGDRTDLMRLGEDEFAILVVSPCAKDDAAQVTQQVQAMLKEPLNLTSHRFFLDVSMGVALHPGPAVTPHALLQSANAAMLVAKRMPGTSVQWATEVGRHEMAAFFEAEQALRSGLEKDEFTLVYQPKVSASEHQLVGFEALVRWDRPGVGRINPMDFIPAAERNGLIVPLGALILNQACSQIAKWRAEGLPLVPVAVNVSPLQLLDVEFPSLVISTLRQFNLDPRWLTLEITETAAVAHMDQAAGQINQLRQQGVEVALDDFGTGFSSLNMLRSLPLHTVKIDRSLIDPMPDSNAVAVVTAICDLATVLRLHVVAEGVETSAHAQAALKAGCHALQGYYFAKPLPVPDATKWLRDQVKHVESVTADVE